MQNEPMLCVQDLSVRFKTKYGSAAAVNHVSFSLKKGEKLGLGGESGSGREKAEGSTQERRAASARPFRR